MWRHISLLHTLIMIGRCKSTAYFSYTQHLCAFFCIFLLMRGVLLLRSKQNKKLQRLKVGKKLYHCTTFAKSGVST